MKPKQAISLIVLVITIIVMIILAGAIILTLNNAGIIGKANEAVNATNEAQLKQIAELGWAEAYMNGARTESELKAGVVAELEANGLDKEDYGIAVTISGVEITQGWLQNGITVVKGSQTLNIGDTVAYDETNNGSITNLTATDWKVLGAENGELLIMSTVDIVKAYYLGEKGNLDESQNDYITGIVQLNDLCVPYKGGKGAVGARSITIEDVNKITGYDPRTYGVGTIEQYGNEVTYYWDGTDKPVYKSSVVNGNLTNTHNLFMWYNEGTDSWVSSQKSTTATTTVPELITATNNSQISTKLNSSRYSYSAPSDTTLDTGSNAFKMLFVGDSYSYYWLASSYVATNAKNASFGMRCVIGSLISYNDLVISDGKVGYNSYGVRAVVSLSNDIVLTGSSETGWTF